MKKDSLIYSVTYENYEKKILLDKENRTQGSWLISKDMVDELKYAYVYLKNSNQMIVKKYEIEYFELNKTSKGYNDEGKQCFVFKKSEDVFFEYPWGTIQGRHYRSQFEMDKLPHLDKGEVERRLNSSKNNTTSSEPNRKIKRKSTGVSKEYQIMLREVLLRDFPERSFPHFEDAALMIKSVEEDPEQDLNALLNEYFVRTDKKKNNT